MKDLAKKPVSTFCGLYVYVLDKLMLTRRLILLLQDANLEGILRLIRSMFLHCGSALRLV